MLLQIIFKLKQLHGKYRIKYSILLFIFVLFLVTVCSGGEFRKITLFTKVTFDLPVSMNKMPDSLLVSKFPMMNSNINKAFSNQDASVTYIFEKTTDKIKPTDLDSICKQMFIELNQNKRIIKIRHAGIVALNKKRYFMFEYFSMAMNCEVFNCTFGSDLDGFLLIGSYTCTTALMKQWEPNRRRMILSLKVK